MWGRQAQQARAASEACAEAAARAGEAACKENLMTALVQPCDCLRENRRTL